MFLYPNIYPIVNKSRSLLIEKMSSTGFINFSNQCISNISNIYSQKKNLSLESQTNCDIMFPDPESNHIFSIFFQLRTCFIFCFFSYVVIIHLLQIGEGVGIYCKLIHDWFKLPRVRLLFFAQCRAGIHNHIQNTTWRSILIQHRVIILTLFWLFDWTVYWVFSPIVFTRP